MIKSSNNLFHQISSLENLFLSWLDFKKDKRKSWEFLNFQAYLEENLIQLHRDLTNNMYQHSHYNRFKICDTKPRIIFKAVIRDRVLHHAVHRILYQIFNQNFICDSFSCRIDKGTHRAFQRLVSFSRKTSKNYHNQCWGLKFDIVKYFDNIDHQILFSLIKKKISEEKVLLLLWKIIKSYAKDANYFEGLPLGNLTSQLFANIYLNELDYFVKEKLKIKFYLRYCDDFIILAPSPRRLLMIKHKISYFLKQTLKLSLHEKHKPKKIRQGFDFCGYIVLPDHFRLRTKTRKKMFKNISKTLALMQKRLIREEKFESCLNSYLGLLKHCNSYKMKLKINKMIYGNRK